MSTLHTTPGSPYKLSLGRVMPTIFIAGPAKSGSTSLWECVHKTFHPDHACQRTHAAGWSDAACGRKPFILPALAADVAQPACLRFSKESAFWRYWGRRAGVSWRRYGGPRLPLAMWQMGQPACGARRRAIGWNDAAGGPRALAAHRQMEDVCLQDVPCASREAGGSRRASGVAYDRPLPAECKPTCEPCELHPGWMNNFDAPCPFAPRPCDSLTCSPPPFLPKRLRALNFSAYHARAFSLSAFPSVDALAAVNISVDRVASLEGNPGIFQTPPRHARALAALTTREGQAKLKFIVGLRDSFDLAFSLWSFLSSIGQEGKRVEQRLGKALLAIRECNETLAANPSLLLDLSAAELSRYRLCLDDRPRAHKHFYLYGGLYGLHLLGWLHVGFRAPQFLFVRMTSLPRDEKTASALQAELSSFLGMGLEQDYAASGGLCLGQSMVTSKKSRLRAHNATVKAVKSSFKATQAANDLKTFLDGHDQMLKLLLQRERVRVY
ncbi:hypothetical protein AB1Y20_000521 [Prymnesium parvum]|uniref:Sulfotransferase n=1 Tax=Prymnesium parvum TaxID=97485 RepID=A0AB34K8S1_PRYPA